MQIFIRDITSVQLKVIECQLLGAVRFKVFRSVFRKQLIERNFLEYVDAQNLQNSA